MASGEGLAAVDGYALGHAIAPPRDKAIAASPAIGFGPLGDGASFASDDAPCRPGAGVATCVRLIVVNVPSDGRPETR
jgi:hypothetical protein